MNEFLKKDEWIPKKYGGGDLLLRMKTSLDGNHLSHKIIFCFYSEYGRLVNEQIPAVHYISIRPIHS